jgi:hypothetical protein
MHRVLYHLRSLAGNRHPALLTHAIAGSARRGGGSPAAPPSVALDGAALQWHLEATYRWLCRAHDATPDGGVAATFDLWRGAWSASYPETTGYIVPTLLALARARGDEEARARALRMAAWESDVQMADGAVLSGVLDMPPAPAVFNTGQVVFGWIAAVQDGGGDRFAESARRACDWLVQRQSEDGAWRGELSIMTDAPIHTFNVRCAWAMAYAAHVLDEPRWLEAARRAADWAVEQQNDVGWFEHNGFTVAEAPLLHTIAYVIEGLLGVHAFTGEPRYLAAAARAVEGVVGAYRTGRLAGRLDAAWAPAVSWRCVTGDAQIAVVLHRLAPHFPQAGYRAVASRLIADVAAMQLSVTGGRRPAPDSGPTVGGVPGSYPVWGAYLPHNLLNWAAKFFLDALLLETAGVDELAFPAVAAVGAGA